MFSVRSGVVKAGREARCKECRGWVSWRFSPTLYPLVAERTAAVAEHKRKLKADTEYKKEYVSEHLEPYIEEGKLRKKRKPYAPSSSVTIQKSKKFKGERSNGVFCPVPDFLAREGRLPTADELSKLSDWLDVDTSDDEGGVRLPDTGQSLTGGCIRLTKVLGAGVKKVTEVGDSDRLGDDHLKRLHKASKRALTEGTDAVMEFDSDGKAVLNSGKLEEKKNRLAEAQKQEKEARASTTTQKKAPPAKNRELTQCDSKASATSGESSVDFSAGLLKKARARARAGMMSTATVGGKKDKTDKPTKGQSAKDKKDKPTKGPGPVKPMAPYQKRECRNAKVQQIEKYLLEAGQKKGNFQQNPAGKDCTSANFRALASKIEKVFDAKWVEACREPDGTIWSDGSTKQEHAEKEKFMLEVEANVLEPYKAKEGDSSYHATAFAAALTELTSHSVVTPLDILKEFINRTFRDDLDNEEFENVVVTLFGDASSSNGHVVHSLSDHEDSMKALFAELLVINRCNEGWLVALAYLCVVPC